MAGKKKPYFDFTNCVSCSICAQVCPVSAIDLTRFGKSGKYKNVYPELVNENCIGCSLCAKGCPMDCIRMMEA